MFSQYYSDLRPKLSLRQVLYPPAKELGALGNGMSLFWHENKLIEAEHSLGSSHCCVGFQQVQSQQL